MVNALFLNGTEAKLRNSTLLFCRLAFRFVQDPFSETALLLAGGLLELWQAKRCEIENEEPGLIDCSG